MVGAPVGSEGVDQKQAATALGVEGPGTKVSWGGQPTVAAGITDLHTERARRRDGEPQPEIPARDTTVRDGISGEFSHEERSRPGGVGVVWPAPGVELRSGETPGQTGATASRAQPDREAVGGDGEFSADGLVIHITQRGRACVT